MIETKFKRALIGSSAIKYHFPDFHRKVNDVDYIVNQKTNKEEHFYIPKSIYKINEDVLSPDELYTLKMSHIFWDINWEKHIFDIQFLQNKNCVLKEDLFIKLFNFWATVHGKRKTPDFNNSNDMFFDDHVDRKYNHDELHQIVTKYDQPLFTKIKRDLNKSTVYENLFNELPRNQKLELVREECYVMSLERYLLSNENLPEITAYRRILKKLILNLTPLWLGLWIVENYKTLKNKPINIKQLYNESTKERTTINR